MWQRNNFSVISGRLWDRILLFLPGKRSKGEARTETQETSTLIAGLRKGDPLRWCGVPHNKLDRSSCVFSAINRSHCGPVEIGRKRLHRVMLDQTGVGGLKSLGPYVVRGDEVQSFTSQSSNIGANERTIADVARLRYQDRTQARLQVLKPALVTEALVEDQSGPDFLQWAGTQNKKPPQIASAEGRVKALPAPPTLRYGPMGGGSKFSSTFRGVFNVSVHE